MRESKKHTVGKKVNRAGLCVCLAGLIAVLAGVTSYAAVPSGNDSTLIRGDVNLDSTVNLKDAIQIQKFALSMIDFNDEQKKCANVDDNNNINLLDSIVVQKYAVGIEIEVKGIGEAITDPVTDPTEHPTKPTEPPTKPTESPTTPTEPTDPSEAEYEWVPLYIRDNRTICNGCGLDVTGNLDHISNCGPNYHSEDVWVLYGTNEWVVKNKDVGNTERYMTTGDDVDALGNHYLTTVGVQGAKRAIREADQMIVDLWFLQDDIYMQKKVEVNYCRHCMISGIDDIEAHNAKHIAEGLKPDSGISHQYVLFKKVKVEK